MAQTTEDLTYPGGLTRLFVDVALCDGAEVELGDDQAHYLAHVMRARSGQSLRVFNGRDGEWLAIITAIAKRTITLSLQVRTSVQTGVPDLWLLLAPIKKTPLDYIVQKATELGVARIQPVITRRTIVERVNLDRMRANATEAAEQSERLTVPDIGEPISLEKLIQSWDTTRRLAFCDESRDAPPAARAFASAKPGPWAILTGPEGGFDPEEREMIRTQDFTLPVALGPRILRADTASLAAIAVWQSTCGDWG
ncbi:MAG: 16S rRNA (uracil(1498)-N(3))-methyltransferase [Micropepsaceae bacterium]